MKKLTRHLKNTTVLVAGVLTLGLNTHSVAAARCVNASGAVVAYAANVAACPAGSSFKGDVDAVAAPTADQHNQAKSLAAKDKTTADALERQRLRDEKAQSKALLALQKRQNSKGKSCRSAEIALARAQDHYDDAAGAKPKMKKQSSKSANKIHTSERAEDTKLSKAQKKAKKKLEAAQDKRGIACS